MADTKHPDFFGDHFGPAINKLDTGARRWLTDRPIAWQLMLEVTYEIMKDGVPFAMKLVIEMLRHRFNVDGTGIRMASNGYTTYFARLLCAWDSDFLNMITGHKKAAAGHDPLEEI